MPTGRRNDRLSKAEIRKDALQEGVTAASHVVGSVATILTTAVGDVAKAVGGFATEIFEIRDSARRAHQDHDLDEVVVAEPAEPTKPTKANRPVSVVKDPELGAQSSDQPKDI